MRDGKTQKHFNITGCSCNSVRLIRSPVSLYVVIEAPVTKVLPDPVNYVNVPIFPPAAPVTLGATWVVTPHGATEIKMKTYSDDHDWTLRLIVT